jgi:hypothetical protein
MVSPNIRVAHHGSVGHNLAGIALALALCGLAFAYAIDAAVRRPAQSGTSSETTVHRTMGGRDLAIPQSWFRYGEQPAEGFASQLDLQLLLPLGEAGAMRPVDMTLLPQSRVRPSARLLDGVYLHRFGAAELDGPPGLVGKPLQGGEGFAGETVWYDPLTADPFVAKCSAPVAAGAPSRCLRSVYLAPGLAAVYGFDAELLANWKQFDPELRRRLEHIGVY